LSLPIVVCDNQVVKDEDILNLVEPILKEYYSTFILVGFKADNKEISVIGDLGCPKAKKKEHETLRWVQRKLGDLLDQENEEDTQGMDSF
jgi:hypothetical protein